MITALVRRDCEVIPLPCLNHLTARLRGPVRHRLEDSERLLIKKADREAVELFLDELIRVGLRQQGGRLCIGPMFAIKVAEMSETTMDALPPSTRHALCKMATMAIDEPIQVSNQRELAHALANNGALVSWLTKEKDDDQTPD